MSNSVFTTVKTVFLHAGILIVLMMLQFLFLNILPRTLNNVDFFLIVSAYYVLKGDYKVSFPFLFFAVYVDEIIFPISKIVGVKTLAALILGYILFLIFKKMVLKGWLLCLTVSVYCVLVFVLTRFFLFFLNYSNLSFGFFDYAVLFCYSFLISCFIGKTFNVR